MAALVVAVIASGLYLPAGSLTMLVAVPVLHGIAYAFASTATMAVAQSAIPPERRAEGTGYYALGSTLATALGPAIGLMIVGHFDYPTLFWVSLTVSIVGLLLGAVLHRTTGRLSFAVHPAPVQEAVPAEPARGAVNRPTFSGRDIAHPAVLPIGAFMLVIGLCYAGVITYLNAYSVERGVVAGAGLFFIAYATAMFVMRFVLGKLQDRRGDNVVVYLGIVFFASALALLAVAEHDWHVVVAGALTGLG